MASESSRFSLFPEAPPAAASGAVLPEGFLYLPQFITPQEEAAMLAAFAGMDFAHQQYYQYSSRRLQASFGLGWHFGEKFGQPGELRPAEAPPVCLAQLAQRVATHFGFEAASLKHIMVTMYPPGAPIGWHRDTPPFEDIYGVSLLSPCAFHLRPHAKELRTRANTIKLRAEPRSLYRLSGVAREDWQHCIPPVKELRYSVTLRTLRKSQPLR